METKNSAIEIELRKRQNTLIIAGAGTIIFGVWSIVKTLGLFYFDRARRMAVLKGMIEAGGETWEDRYYLLAVVLTVIILMWDLAFRAFIGWAAISEGMGKRRSILYIIVACLMLLGSAGTITGLSSEYVRFLVQLTSETPEATTQDPSLSAVIIEITSLIMLVEMIHASIRVRKLTKESGKHMKHGHTGKHGR